MDLARLRTLRELSLRKTMAAVADALLVSPSAVSQQIAQLEAEAGMALVERRGRGVRLTAAGERLAQHTGRIVGILEEARTDLAVLRATVTGELRVAAFPSVAASLIPPAIRALSSRFPSLVALFEELEPANSIAALRGWQIDVAIIDDLATGPDLAQASVDTEHLLDDRLYVMLPPDHRLASRPYVTLADLAAERWSLDTRSGLYAGTIIEACRKAGFEPTIIGRCHSFEVLRAMVEAGCSISINPGLRGREHIGRLQLLEIRPAMTRRILVAYRRGELRNPALVGFVEELHLAAAMIIAQR